MSLQQHLETFFQVSSAAGAHLFFQISGTPVLQEGTVFKLPGFSLEVAPECSGIHSSLVLFITSFVAGHLLLRNLWAKGLLVFFVIPLAIIRNGIRIFTIGQLCVHVSPDIIHSYIHRHGGPIFFAGSLIPFFLLLFFLMKIESNMRRSSVKLLA
jgi:exosortase